MPDLQNNDLYMLIPMGIGALLMVIAHLWLVVRAFGSGPRVVTNSV